MTFNKEDFNKLNSRVDNLINDGAISRRSHGLVHLLLSQKFLRESDEIREAIVDGGNDCGIDAIYIDRKPDQPIINVIQSKCNDSERKARSPFKSSELLKISRFFDILRDGKSDLKKLVNPDLEQKILEIRDIQKTDFPIFKVWLISNGNPCAAHEIQPVLSKFKAQEIELEEFHLISFMEFCINSRSSRAQHVFRVREVGVLESGNTELSSVVGYISARELYNLLKDLRDDRKMDYSLFDMNVRSFLGTDSPINKEIYKSAASPHNSHFSSLNNGITIVGTEVKVMRTAEPCKIGIKKMSIVNGAQTCSAIFDCMKDQYPNFKNFENLSVLFRLFKTDDPAIIEQIAISTNSQNRIQPRDLKANDNNQIRLEEELSKKGIKYMRKRGSFEYNGVESTEKKLDALHAGQLLLSYVHREPANAKRQSDLIFSDWYSKIFSSINIDKLVRAYELYIKIEQYQKFISDEVRIRGVLRTENTFITYGGFHVLTLCGKLEELHPEKSDDELIQSSLDIITKCIVEAGQPAYYSFFRDSNMTNKMLEKCYQLELFEEHKKTSTG